MPGLEQGVNVSPSRNAEQSRVQPLLTPGKSLAEIKWYILNVLKKTKTSIRIDELEQRVEGYLKRPFDPEAYQMGSFYEFLLTHLNDHLIIEDLAKAQLTETAATNANSADYVIFPRKSVVSERPQQRRQTTPFPSVQTQQDEQADSKQRSTTEFTSNTKLEEWQAKKLNKKSSNQLKQQGGQLVNSPQNQESFTLQSQSPANIFDPSPQEGFHRSTQSSFGPKKLHVMYS